jgi:hypothetical protein
MVSAIEGANLTLRTSNFGTLRSNSYFRVSFVLPASGGHPSPAEDHTRFFDITEETSGEVKPVADSLSQIDTAPQTSYDSTKNLAKPK